MIKESGDGASKLLQTRTHRTGLTTPNFFKPFIDFITQGKKKKKVQSNIKILVLQSKSRCTAAGNKLRCFAPARQRAQEQPHLEETRTHRPSPQTPPFRDVPQPKGKGFTLLERFETRGTNPNSIKKGKEALGVIPRGPRQEGLSPSLPLCWEIRTQL